MTDIVTGNNTPLTGTQVVKKNNPDSLSHAMIRVTSILSNSNAKSKCKRTCEETQLLVY